MKLSLEEYKDKVLGCWMGKNIGGTLGAPFEGFRQINQVDYYVQDVNENPPPNDDLDLQLLWLNAVERYGNQVNASILGEYWLSFVIPDWAEYGAGKNNLRMGLVPPLSGYVGNPYRDSCGCYIRSEIWACLAPGNPEIAVRYAYEDAVVDHSEEGLYGEIFWAAVQSAAFVEKDKYKLIEIGLSYIPEDSGVAKGIKTAIDSYQSGVSWQEARRNVLISVPGTFGVMPIPLAKQEEGIPIGEPGWDAPSNIGITILGWLYGEDDFGNSLCIAVNCGEDTDCTGATLGATLGIIHGRKELPEKWTKPIGDVINTICVNYLSGTLSIPKTVTELTDRILRLTPWFLGNQYVDFFAEEEGYTITIPENQSLYCRTENEYCEGLYNVGAPRNQKLFSELLKRAPFAVQYDFVAFEAVLDYQKEPFIQINESRKIKVTLENNKYFNHPQWLTIKCYKPDGVNISSSSGSSVFLPTYNVGKVELEFDILVEEVLGNKVELLLDITSQGRHSRGIIPVTLVFGNADFN
ncbi:hypothetical protein COJ85_31575 [Bacillus sp. AFS076308]|uniref:ADP-ribosylglycohydrolase family protein n=1 Tax=unclassified Bacillus (in: firmicutes) TaxID=185979 RepID=UPI000BF6478F|nr:MULTISPECIES: ADP-ribosylglycohydrolase family protein [unclassified Bacillus (in: firmicutes)]PFN78144.1 hypothetical protein COJ85_31575 [Bacillus sp. AFS076308]PGV48651.1 hypothetical protein COD92_25375 [Bacillus sp. AFS037270]